MAYQASPEGNSYQSVKRVRIWYALLVAVMAIFLVRLFYLQVIRHDHYKTAALSDQLKQYEVPATRGTILAYDVDKTIPIVLNEELYTLYADPSFIKDAPQVARDVAGIIGGDSTAYEKLMRVEGSRYQILAKKLTEEQKDKVAKLEHPGLGTQQQDYRTYPQGTLASQVLGFVNAEGKGSYGIEQALNDKLKGQPGELKAITDVRGVPLAASGSNLQKPAVPGDDIVLTLDIAMQKQVELLLESGLKRAQSQKGSAVVMDVKTGAVKAMANFPSYDPAKYSEVENAELFSNNAVARPLEVGSIMKVLTTTAAMDVGAVDPNGSYYDPGGWKIDDFTITNVEGSGGPGTRPVLDILYMSLNTGATWELMQMGGGKINEKARTIWHDYMVNRYFFGRETGIEQGYEASGYVPKPGDNGAGINLTYANTSFGQAMTATPVQMAAAMSAVLNGGTYHKPYLIDGVVQADGSVKKAAPKVVRKNIVSQKSVDNITNMMQIVAEGRIRNPKFDTTRYSVGGKTGTAQVAKPSGGYYTDKFHGTYLGFVGGNKPEYVIVVFVEDPKIPGYAGSAAAQPIFADIGHMLINNSFVTAKN